MTDFELIPEVEAVPVRRGRPVFAWLVIILCVLAAALLASLVPVVQDSARDDRLAVAVLQLQARYLVGSADLFKNIDDRQILDQVAALDAGSVEQRLRFVILTGEFAGADEALDYLAELHPNLQKHGVKPTQRQAELMDILERLYEDYSNERFEAPAVNATERSLLRKELGWFGELALAPKEIGADNAARVDLVRSARKTVFVLMAAVVGFGLLGIGGFIGGIVFLVLLAIGNVRGGLSTPSGSGGIYAETFALWMALFFGLDLLASVVSARQWQLFVIGLAFLMSLSALAWPVLRGIPWRQVREDIGFTWGKNPLAEAMFGLTSYILSIPIMAVGLLATLALMWLLGNLMEKVGPSQDDFSPSGGPAHPIIEFLIGGDIWSRLQIIFLASVAAPLVEETMFRGVLYRHVRDATGRFGFALSVLFSAVVVSFIFAVIHPQGIVAVPVLMALAFGFSLAREWRGSLMPGMVAHGVHNGLVLTLAMLALGS